MLRACPVVQRRRTGADRKSVKHDVIMDALRVLANGERSAQRQALVQREGTAWLGRQAKRCGFAVDPTEVSAEGYRQIRVARGRGRAPMRFSSLDLSGILTVQDSGLLLKAITRGFGAARAFGCGLMLVEAAVKAVNTRPTPGATPPKPIPIKDRASILFVEKGQLDVLDGAFVLVDGEGVRMHIPVGGLSCLMLEPGIRVSHAAVALAARVGCLLVWVGEAGVRLYSAGQPGGARADRLLHQARLALDPDCRLKVVRKMYSMRFDEPRPATTFG